jgi:hypothetical protein
MESQDIKNINISDIFISGKTFKELCAETFCNTFQNFLVMSIVMLTLIQYQVQ